MAADLYALLYAAGIPPPYVLVGHSIGGIIARRFCVQYPGLVAGMLLVESSHEDQGSAIAAVDWRFGPGMLVEVAARRQARILGPRRLAASFGLMRSFDAMVAREAPPEYADAYRAILLSARHRHASSGTAHDGQDAGAAAPARLHPADRPHQGTTAAGENGMSGRNAGRASRPVIRQRACPCANEAATTCTSTSRTWSSRRSAISSGAAGEPCAYRRKAGRVVVARRACSRRTAVALPQKTSRFL